MEQKFSLPTPDSYYVHGVQNSQSNYSAKSVILFVHGLSGNIYESHYFNAVPFFTSRGYDTIRFGWNSDEEKGRGLQDVTLQTVVDDLTLVIEHYSHQYEQIFLVGHSFGCSALARAHQGRVAKLVYWDPSAGMTSLEDKAATYVPSLDKYLLDWGLTLLVSPQLVQDWQEISNIPEELNKITLPTKFIFAENCEIYDKWKPHLGMFQDKVPLEVTSIPHASHIFVEEGVQEVLFTETLRWIN